MTKKRRMKIWFIRGESWSTPSAGPLCAVEQILGERQSSSMFVCRTVSRELCCCFSYGREAVFPCYLFMSVNTGCSLIRTMASFPRPVLKNHFVLWMIIFRFVGFFLLFFPGNILCSIEVNGKSYLFLKIALSVKGVCGIYYYLYIFYRPVSCRSLVDRCGSLGSCKPQI